MKQLLLSVLAVIATAGIPLHAQTPDETARFLAGLYVKEPKLAALSSEGWWQRHSNTFGAAWARMDRRQLLGVRGWAQTKIPQYHQSSAPVFYFFSGPDFLYANTFFPNASTYVLCGIEPVGNLPDIAQLPPDAVAAEIDGLRQSLNTVISTHYFITKDMRTDLSRARLGGTLPLLYVFLARCDCTIQDVKLIPGGVQIAFRGPLGQKQALYYFKTDLSNAGGNGSFLKFCSGLGKGMSLVKSASYLMHGDSFSGARNFLLQNSRVIVQDDTGIPYRHFAPVKWEVTLFGKYVPGGETFGKYYQRDMAAEFERIKPQALGFSFGYHWQKERGMLMLAQPK